jgi:hypothetical protein
MKGGYPRPYELCEGSILRTKRFVENLSEVTGELGEMFGSRMPKALALSTLFWPTSDSIAGRLHTQWDTRPEWLPLVRKDVSLGWRMV